MEYAYEYTLPDGRHIGVVISERGSTKRQVHGVEVDGHERIRIYAPENPEENLERRIMRMLGFNKE
ncbi:hypothetical protein J4443_03755 [Candidatus Woesearchaeota archaeon]|nr:hypothetical protein [Candidatus Woesearchaeota archaeon]